jgi:UrcA family protein
MSIMTPAPRLRGLIAIAIFGAFLGSLYATPAAAARAEAPSLADLDMSRSTDVTTAYARIRYVARKSCQPADFDIRVLGAVARVNRCTEQTVARMVEDEDVPALTAYHQAQTGRQAAVVWHH